MLKIYACLDFLLLKDAPVLEHVPLVNFFIHTGQLRQKEII